MYQNSYKTNSVSTNVRFSENELIEYGKAIAETSNIPKDYDIINSIRGLYLMCVSSRSGNLLEKCTQESIEEAVRTMIAKRLNPLKNQCYPIAYGNRLVVQPSYQGNIRSVYASNPYVVKNSIRAQVIREKDIFEDATTTDGRVIIVKHQLSPLKDRTQSNPIIGAYAVAMVRLWDNQIAPSAIVMSMADIKTSWAQGTSGGAVAQKFTEEMAKKTVVNRLCKWLRDSTDESDITFGDTLLQNEEDCYDINIDYEKTSNPSTDIDAEPQEEDVDIIDNKDEDHQQDIEVEAEDFASQEADDVQTTYYDETINDTQVEIPQQHDEIIEVRYAEYKDNIDKYEMIKGSYDKERKTCKVKIKQ